MSKHFCSVSLIGRISCGVSPSASDEHYDMVVATRRPERINGEWIEVTEQHVIRATGTNADYMVNFCKIGLVVAVDGDLHYDDFGDGDVAFITCNRVTLLNPPPEAVEFKREIG